MLTRIRKSMDEKDEGFTLIELLVVIIIIGILAAIAIPVFLNQRQKGVDAGLKSDLKQMANEVETAFTDTQTYPATAPVIRVTTGNVLAYKVSVDGNFYCINAFNPKGTANAAAKVYNYVSNAGGLQPGVPAAASTACG